MKEGKVTSKIYLIEFTHDSYPIIQEKRLIEANDAVKAWHKVRNLPDAYLIDIKVIEEVEG